MPAANKGGTAEPFRPFSGWNGFFICLLLKKGSATHASETSFIGISRTPSSP